MRYCTFKISIFYICVRVSHYVLCLQTLLCIESVLFQGTRFSTHRVLGVKNGIRSQNLQYHHIFHLFISRFEFFFLLIFHMLCWYRLSFILKYFRNYVYLLHIHCIRCEKWIIVICFTHEAIGLQRWVPLQQYLSDI